jgi:hypothetical protein
MNQLLPIRRPAKRSASAQSVRGRILINDLVVAFGEGPAMRTAVDHATIDIAPGVFVCVLGP